MFQRACYPIALLGLLLSAAPAVGADKVPDDVARFIRHAEQCSHLAGEWDSSLPDSERRRIERAVDRHCGAAHERLGRLERKYRANGKLRQVLADHAYDAVTGYQAEKR